MPLDAWVWALGALVGVFGMLAVGRALRRQPHRNALERKGPPGDRPRRKP